MSLAPPYVPVEVTDVDLAFPAHGLRLMPKWEDMDERGIDHGWFQLANDLFSGNYGADTELLPTVFLVDNGVEYEVAWRHLRCVLGSYEPKHQHKILAVAFLLQLWFRWAKWTPVGSPGCKTVGNPDVPVTLADALEGLNDDHP